MVKFIDVDPSEIPELRESRRGRVSYPILKSFLETNKVLVKLDRTGVSQNVQTLTVCLNSYIRTHELPIKIFQRSGNLYIMRTDTDDNGKLINTDYIIGQKLQQDPEEELEDIPELSDEDVEANFR